MRATTILLFFLFANFLFAQPATFTPMGTGGGGALFAPSISPYDHDEIYMVCDMAGVFHTEDAGQQWEMFHYEDLISTNRAKMQFTSDPNVLYTLRFREGSRFRLYPVKSTDGGETWTALTNPDESLFWYIYADPNSTERLIICTYDGILFSENGGGSFSEIYHDNEERLYVAGAFWDDNDIYIGMDEGLLFSDNGGNSFSLNNVPGLPANAGFFSFAGAKQNGTVRLCGTVVPSDLLEMETEPYHIDNPDFLGLYQLDFGMGNWVLNDNFSNQEIPYLVDMPIDNINVIYTITHRPDEYPNVYKSTNGGDSWANTFFAEGNQNITTGYAGHWGDFSWFWGGSAQALDVADNDPDHVVVTDFGFVHGTQDGGNSWRQMYVNSADENAAGSPTPEFGYYRSSGLNQTTCHWITWASPEKIFVSYTDVSLQYSSDGGSTWTYGRDHFLHSNTYKIIQHPTANTLYAITSDVNDVYLPFRLSDDQIDDAEGKLLRSTDYGQNWTILHDFERLPVWLEMDPADPNTLYASIVHSEDGGIYKSTDAGNSWSKLADPPRTEGHPNAIRILSDGSLVASFSARDANGDDNYSQSAGVFYSTDGGGTWQDRTAPGMCYYTLEVVVSPHDENLWVATVADHFDDNGLVENGGLYRSFDRGQNWARVHKFGFTHSATFHPVNPDILYVTHEGGGLYYSENATAANPVFDKVQGYPYSRPKRVFFSPYNPDEVWVTTMGGAVWKGTDSSTSIFEKNNAAEIYFLENIPNPFSEKTTIRFNLTKSGEIHFRIFSENGKLIQSSIYNFPAGKNEIYISEKELGGTGLYFYQLEMDGKTVAGKMVME